MDIQVQIQDIQVEVVIDIDAKGGVCWTLGIWSLIVVIYVNNVIILFDVLKYFSKHIQDKHLSVIQLTLNVHISLENSYKKIILVYEKVDKIFYQIDPNYHSFLERSLS